MKNTIVVPTFVSHSGTAAAVSATATASAAVLETMQTRFAMRVASSLSERCEEVNPDISERLRFARERALTVAAIARSPETTAPVGVTRSGGLLLGRIGAGWWLKLGSLLPVVVLVAGLVQIQHWQDSAQISVAAEVDAALLADKLPPGAYGDAGFAEFLKTPRE